MHCHTATQRRNPDAATQHQLPPVLDPASFVMFSETFHEENACHHTQVVEKLEARRSGRKASLQKYYLKNKEREREKGKIRAKRSRLRKSVKLLEEKLENTKGDVEYVEPRRRALETSKKRIEARIAALESMLDNGQWTISQKDVACINSYKMDIRRWHLELKTVSDALRKILVTETEVEKTLLHIQNSLATARIKLEEWEDANPAPEPLLFSPAEQRRLSAEVSMLREISDQPIDVDNHLGRASLPLSPSSPLPPSSPLSDKSWEEF